MRKQIESIGYPRSKPSGRFAPKWVSRPEGYIARITPRRDLRIVQLHEARLGRFSDDARDRFGPLFRQLEPFAKSLVRHSLVHHISKTAMLITGADSVAPVHILKPFMSEQYDCRATLTDPEIRRWKLINLGAMHNLIDPAALLFANADTTHEIPQTLVPRLILIDEALWRNEGLAWIGYLDPILIDFDGNRSTGFPEILMN